MQYNIEKVLTDSSYTIKKLDECSTLELAQYKLKNIYCNGTEFNKIDDNKYIENKLYQGWFQSYPIPIAIYQIVEYKPKTAFETELFSVIQKRNKNKIN